MKTTIMLKDSKVEQAFALTKLKTTTELLDTALDNLIRKYQIQELKEYFGKVNLNINLDELRNREPLLYSAFFDCGRERRVF